MKNQRKEVKKKVHPVHNYFAFNREKQESICKTAGCILKGKHSSNLLRHIQRKHKQIVKVLEPEIKKYQLDAACQENGKTVNVKLNKNDIIKACIELTTVNGRPYSLISDSGFRRLMNPVFNAFKENGDHFTLTHHNIREYAEVEIVRIERSISNELNGKIISLKFDSVTIMER